MTGQEPVAGRWSLSSFPRRLCTAVARQGAIPKHIAFIMDGNRRFARRLQEKGSAGHAYGFEKLKEVCVREVLRESISWHQ